MTNDVWSYIAVDQAYFHDVMSSLMVIYMLQRDNRYIAFSNVRVSR